jgi:hypothetical protein
MIIIKKEGKKDECFENTEDLFKKYPIDINKEPEDMGFGKCGCGQPLIESADKKYIHCYEEVYCKNNSKPILK